MTDQNPEHIEPPSTDPQQATPGNPPQTIVGNQGPNPSAVSGNGHTATSIPAGQTITNQGQSITASHPIWYFGSSNTTGQWITVGSTAIVGTIGTGTVVCDDPGPAIQVPVKDQEGCKCVKCDEWYPYGRSNQDNGTLICYACRNNL